MTLYNKHETYIWKKIRYPKLAEVGLELIKQSNQTKLYVLRCHFSCRQSLRYSASRSAWQEYFDISSTPNIF